VSEELAAPLRAAAARALAVLLREAENKAGKI
jgi:hypothetical protein